MDGKQLNINHVSNTEEVQKEFKIMKRYTIAIEETVIVKRIYTVDAESNREALEKFDKSEGLTLIENEELDTVDGFYGEPEPVILDREELDD